jgi:hypothetical protein
MRNSASVFEFIPPYRESRFHFYFIFVGWISGYQKNRMPLKTEKLETHMPFCFSQHLVFESLKNQSGENLKQTYPTGKGRGMAWS